MRVELDIFSGRPNPRWELDPDERETITAILADLPEPLPELGPPDRPLGYRGFRIIDSGQNRTVTVQGGTVLIHSGGRVAASIDASARLEGALVKIARSYLEPAVYEYLLTQLHP